MLRRQNHFGFIGEVHLHDLVAQTEQDRVACFHPFFKVDHRGVLRVFEIGDFLQILLPFQVVFEMLKQCHFLLEFFWIIMVIVLVDRILPIIGLAFHVLEILALRMRDDLSRIVEEHTRAAVRQQVTESVLRRIVDPFLDEHLVLERVGLVFSAVDALREIVGRLLEIGANGFLREQEFILLRSIGLELVIRVHVIRLCVGVPGLVLCGSVIEPLIGTPHHLALW